MKTLNLIAFIFFGTLSALAGVLSLITKRIELAVLCAILGAVSYVAYKDYKDPDLT